jgi:hypothetical protein
MKVHYVTPSCVFEIFWDRNVNGTKLPSSSSDWNGLLVTPPVFFPAWTIHLRAPGWLHLLLPTELGLLGLLGQGLRHSCLWVLWPTTVPNAHQGLINSNGPFCVPATVKTLSFIPSPVTWWGGDWHVISQTGYGGTERLRNLPKATPLWVEDLCLAPDPASLKTWLLCPNRIWTH